MKEIWTKERCYNAAKECNSRGEYKKMFEVAYQKSLKKGWINDYTWFSVPIKNLYTDKIDLIYAYILPNNVAYIGRTIKLNVRHWEHLNRPNKDVVARYIRDNNLILPEPIILEKDLTLEEGLEREEYWVNYYSENGYKLLNTKSCGISSGSLGSLGRGKWSKKKTFDEARKYNSKSEFRKYCDSGYQAAYKHNWLKDYTWFERPIVYNKKWTEEKCLSAAKRCKTLKEFRENFVTAYDVSKKNGWIKYYNWLINANATIWTKEKCLQEAKKYKTKSEFRKKSKLAYDKASAHKWLSDISKTVWG